MGKDWILETVVKGKKKTTCWKRSAGSLTAPVLAWHALGTRGWGLRHACSPLADARQTRKPWPYHIYIPVEEILVDI